MVFKRRKLAGGRDIRLPDVGCVPVSIIARVPAVTAAMDLASGSGRGGTLLYHNSVTLLPLPLPFLLISYLAPLP